MAPESDSINRENQPKENFETSIKRLEQLISELERGDLPLELALARYEEGMSRLKNCYAILESVEKKVVLLSKREEGSIQESPFSLDQAKSQKKA